VFAADAAAMGIEPRLGTCNAELGAASLEHSAASWVGSRAAGMSSLRATLRLKRWLLRWPSCEHTGTLACCPHVDRSQMIVALRSIEVAAPEISAAVSLCATTIAVRQRGQCQIDDAFSRGR
jgi:hypothetical protein